MSPATCGECGRSWDDEKHPTPSGRCFYEHLHKEKWNGTGTVRFITRCVEPNVYQGDTLYAVIEFDPKRLKAAARLVELLNEMGDDLSIRAIEFEADFEVYDNISWARGEGYTFVTREQPDASHHSMRVSPTAVHWEFVVKHGGYFVTEEIGVDQLDEPYVEIVSSDVEEDAGVYDDPPDDGDDDIF